VLVGFDHADDAGVYLLTPETALVQTVDFFTPIVDDPYTFGQIAATNALSDVYAMGGKPLTSLALVCFPDKGDLNILERILAGGLSKMVEAGCTVVGGHSIRDEETKFGYSVTGVIHPQRVLANQGAQPGDRLLFTKALGTGVISTAIKKGVAKQEWIDAAVKSMTTLNKPPPSNHGRRNHHRSRRGGRPRPPSRAKLGSNVCKAYVVCPCPDRRHRLRPDRPRSRNGTGFERQPFLPNLPAFPCSKARSIASAPATFPAASRRIATLPNAWSTTIRRCPKISARFCSTRKPPAVC
jgi:hypothetical protein